MLQVRVWSDLATARMLPGAKTQSIRATHVMNGHEGAVIFGAFDSHSNRVASTSDDGTVRVWRLDTNQPLLVLRGNTAEVWPSPFMGSLEFI